MCENENLVDYFPDLESIVLCEFDSIVGPRMSCQFPTSSCIADEVFRRVYHFLIIKRNDLCENGISWTDDISGQSLAGYPVLIENPKYARNALIYNVCLVGGREANVSLLLCMAEKLARLLKSAELQFGFLSKSDNRSEKLTDLVGNIYNDLKSKGETNRVLDESFPFFVALPKCHVRKKIVKIKPTEIPFLKLLSSKWSVTDSIASKIVANIDGQLSVAQVAARIPVPYSTVEAIISQLERLDLVGLRPTVNQWDMYTVSSRLSLLLSEDKLRRQCITAATLEDSQQPASFENILTFLTQLQHGITIGDLKMLNKSISQSIDVDKVVLFALELKLIKRVVVSPVYSRAEQRQVGGSVGTADESILSGRTFEHNSPFQSSRGAVSSQTSAFEEPQLEQAYRLMDGNHPLEFIAARSAMDPGELLRAVRGDPACQLLLR